MQDWKDGSYSQVTSTAMDNKWREDFERMKKARVHRYCSKPLYLPVASTGSFLVDNVLDTKLNVWWVRGAD